MPVEPLKIDDRAFQRALKRIDRDSKDVAAKRAIEGTGKSVIRRSQKLTPVDEGDVRASHSFTTTEDDGNVVGTITVSDPARLSTTAVASPGIARGRESSPSQYL